MKASEVRLIAIYRHHTHQKEACIVRTHLQNVRQLPSEDNDFDMIEGERGRGGLAEGG